MVVEMFQNKLYLPKPLSWHCMYPDEVSSITSNSVVRTEGIFKAFIGRGVGVLWEGTLNKI